MLAASLIIAHTKQLQHVGDVVKVPSAASYGGAANNKAKAKALGGIIMNMLRGGIIIHGTYIHSLSDPEKGNNYFFLSKS